MLAEELLEWLDEVVDDLGIREDTDYVHTILERGTSADRQLATYHRTGDLNEVVDQLVAETQRGLD